VVDAARRAFAAGELRVGSLVFPWRPVAQGLAVGVVLTTIGFAEGGLVPRTWRLASIAVLVLAATALLSRERIVLRRLDWFVLAALAALVVWTALSAAWSSQPTASLLQAERVLVYLAGVLAFLLVAERAALPHVLVGALAGITVIAAYGLTRYVVAPPPLDQFEGKLLYQPFGYANALGIFTAIGIVLAVGLAFWAQGATARAAALAPILVLAPALYYTSSRGAWLALVGGLAVVVGFGSRARPAVLAPLLTILAAAVVAGVVAASPHDRTLSRFAGENRPHYWHVALDDYQAHPVLGSGAGTYGSYWLRHRPDRSFTRTAHSLYLQSLAELGPVGLVLVIAALGLPLVALRGRPHPLAGAAAGGYVAYLLHTGIDWDWEMPAATLAGLACGAALLLAARDERGPGISPRTRTALLAVVLVLTAVGFVRLATGPATPFGT